MFLEVLKAKIHRATVTGAELHYEGSLALGPELIAEAGMVLGEKVQVVNINNGARFETYIIEGKSQEVCLNGAAARLGLPGDKVIIIAYALMTPEEVKAHRPKLVFVDDTNRIASSH